MKKLSSAAMALLVVASFSFSITDAQAKVRACSQKQQVLIKKHITKQINAITESDWKSAYSFAAPSFQNAVPIEFFEKIMKNQYDFLIYNNGFGFGACKNVKNSFNQIVTVDFKGVKRILSYELVLVGNRLGVASANEAKASTSTTIYNLK